MRRMKNVPPFCTVSFQGVVAFSFGKSDPPQTLTEPFVMTSSPATSTSFLITEEPLDCVNTVPSATAIFAGK